MAAVQGDQLRFLKISLKTCPSLFYQNNDINFTVVNSSPQVCATSVILNNLPKVKNHPIGEKSPDLVTLLRCPFQTVAYQPGHALAIAQSKRGCQMAYFQTKNSNLGKFYMVLQWKMLAYFMDTWSILCTFFCCILWAFGIHTSW
jgi:hypothetical protein